MWTERVNPQSLTCPPGSVPPCARFAKHRGRGWQRVQEPWRNALDWDQPCPCGASLSSLRLPSPSCPRLSDFHSVGLSQRQRSAGSLPGLRFSSCLVPSLLSPAGEECSAQTSQDPRVLLWAGLEDASPRRDLSFSSSKASLSARLEPAGPCRGRQVLLP